MKRLMQLINADPLAAEILNGAYWLAFGLILLWPTDSYSVTGAFRVLHLLIPSETVAGALFTAIGVCILAVTAFGNRHLQRLAMFASFLLWLGLVVSFVLSSATGAMIHVVTCLSSFWAYIRLAVHHD